MPPKQATIQAMDEVLGPIIGITLVLMAVFLPTRLPGRHHRPALPAVRADDRRHGAHQRHQRRDAQAGPVRRRGCGRPRSGRTSSTAASTPSTTACERSTRAIVRRLVRHVSLMMLAVRRRWSALTGWWYHAAADRLPSRRGPGLRHRRRPAARRRVAGAARAR